MSNSICRFMPAKGYTGSIKAVHFVLETDFHTLRQPFMPPIHYAHLVTRGSGKLLFNGQEYPLKAGSLYFAFPAVPYEIQGDKDLEYMYISFMGAGASAMMEHLQIDYTCPVRQGFEGLIDFWKDAIRRIDSRNANILAEGVLLYTLSFLSGEEAARIGKNNENLFETIIDYVDRHCTDKTMQLRHVAGIFSYTEKYLSHLFKKNMQINFNTYVNNLRIGRAYELIDRGVLSVAELAEACGYADAMYFSKVFKRKTGISPKEYMAQAARRQPWLAVRESNA